MGTRPSAIIIQWPSGGAVVGPFEIFSVQFEVLEVPVAEPLLSATVVQWLSGSAAEWSSKILSVRGVFKVLGVLVAEPLLYATVVQWLSLYPIGLRGAGGSSHDCMVWFCLGLAMHVRAPQLWRHLLRPRHVLLRSHRGWRFRSVLL